jgi:hypothetical protein
VHWIGGFSSGGIARSGHVVLVAATADEAAAQTYRMLVDDSEEELRRFRHQRYLLDDLSWRSKS